MLIPRLRLSLPRGEDWQVTPLGSCSSPTVGVSPLLLAPPPPPFFHQSLVLHLGSSLFNSFPSSLFLLADPPSPASVSTSVCLTVSSPFLPTLSPLRPSFVRVGGVSPSVSLEDRREREREREVERLVRSCSARTHSRTHTLEQGPKINSSCSLHFLPDVKQPFVRSCQASQERPRGVPTPWTFQGMAYRLAIHAIDAW